MSGFNVYQDSYIGATIISNRFIDEYMNDANDAQIKVYLYLVRMLNAHLETSVADIADRFNHTEKDVMRAFKYWESRGLLTLDYDDEEALVGVHLVNLCKTESQGPTIEATHKKVKVEPKPSYTAKELAEYSQEQGNQLVFLAETYFARPLSQNDLQTLCYINEGLGLSEDLVDYLLQYCAEKGKKDFRYAEKVAIGWKEKGITSISQAAGNNLKYEKNVYAIMNRLGIQSSPTEAELKYINKWLSEYKFSDEIIMEACDRAVLATTKNRIKYAEGMLSSWFKQGVKTIEDIHAMDEEHRKKFSEAKSSVSDKPAKRTNQAGNFGNFQQADIDFEELSRKVFVN